MDPGCAGLDDDDEDGGFFFSTPVPKRCVD